MWLDIILLVLFAVFVGLFLFRNRKNLKREGLLLLYKTKWGINLINKTSKKYPKILKVLSYVSVILGYILMVGVLYLVGQLVWVYVFNVDVVRAIKVPPVTPLIPYLPQIFKLNFLPPFYFIYWIVILAVIAISHEFFHGIFAARYKIKIKKTGFGFFPNFLPVFLAAFVELDEKQMQKKPNFSQRAVLSAGTFANIITTFLALAIIVIFFSLSFHASGVVFDDYAYNIVNVSSITMLNGINLNNPTYAEISSLMNATGKNKFLAGNQTYFGLKGVTSDKTKVALYYDSPAIEANLYGPIVSINGVDITNINSFQKQLNRYSIGENITLTTDNDGNLTNYKITLKENPTQPKTAWLGVSFLIQKKTFANKVFSIFSSYKKNNIYYQANYGFATFIYNLLWWLLIISFSVALINMLPMGIFDGGRFFYLTILAITKSEKVAKNAFKIATYFFLFLLAVLMFFWVKSFF
jgi:membrane-associated protease RseP (regulator of RpoE activity)